MKSPLSHALLTLICLFSVFPLTGQKNNFNSGSWKTLARVMVNEQIIARGISDEKVIHAMLTVPRHRFVPVQFMHMAYNDHPLPIGYDQTISQPYIVALMTELLDIKSNDIVLEIGTGSGYQAAVLSKLCKQVYTIEIVKPLAERSAELLTSMGYDNIRVKWGDGYLGWPEFAPFDKIIVTAAPEQIPQALVDQLKIGGKMVLPVGTSYQELIVITKTGQEITKDTIIPVRFVPMIHGDSTQFNPE